MSECYKKSRAIYRRVLNALYYTPNNAITIYVKYITCGNANDFIFFTSSMGKFSYMCRKRKYFIIKRPIINFGNRVVLFRFLISI